MLGRHLNAKSSQSVAPKGVPACLRARLHLPLHVPLRAPARTPSSFILTRARPEGPSRGGGSSRGWDRGEGEGGPNEEGSGTPGPSRPDSSTNPSSRNWLVGGSSYRGQDGSSAYTSSTGRGSGSSRDWVGWEGSQMKSSRDWDEDWRSFARAHHVHTSVDECTSSTSSMDIAPSRGAGSSRTGPYDTFFSSTGTAWTPRSGSNISSYFRMNEERIEGLQWLARYLAGKRNQTGWLWNDEAKALAELKRRGIECCAHHGGKHLYYVPGHPDQVPPGGIFRLLYKEVDSLRESRERADAVDRQIAGDLRAAIKAKLPEGLADDVDQLSTSDPSPPQPPFSTPQQNRNSEAPTDSSPSSSQQQPLSEYEQSAQDRANSFLFGDGKGPQ